MRKAIYEAMKIISETTPYDVKAWHKACIEILDLGFSDKDYKNFVNETTTNEDKLLNFESGCFSISASVIMNFLVVDKQNIDCCSGLLIKNGLAKQFVKYIEDNFDIENL